MIKQSRTSNELLKILLRDISNRNFKKYNEALKEEKKRAVMQTTRNSEKDYKGQLIKIGLLENIFNLSINGLFSEEETKAELLEYLKQDTGRYLKRLTDAAQDKTILLLNEII